MSDPILLSERDGAVLVLTMNRPRAKNALDAALVESLGAALRGAAADTSVRVVVLTGAGGSFCSGADLKASLAPAVGSGDFAEQIDRALDAYHAMIHAIVGAPKAFIAMVDGPAVGFGCDLALACDL